MLFVVEGKRLEMVKEYLEWLIARIARWGYGNGIFYREGVEVRIAR